MLADLQDKVAIVTGGTSGIGRDTAILLSKAGAKVVVAGRREKEGKEVVDLITDGHHALFVKSGVSQSSQVQSLVQRTVEKLGRLDLAFNNAGIEGNWISIVTSPKKIGIARLTST
jgi:NAD(P)-dependent dehydrogenase (short-subunit alcohol dehydrogenase family)